MLPFYAALAAVSLTRTSATWDEPQHLAAGYTALRSGDYRVDPEHPPLTRMLAALPMLLAGDPPPRTAIIDATPPAAWYTRALFSYAHDVLYADPHADRRLYTARFTTVALGLLLGALVFLWTREWLGVPAAAMALGMYVVEPNLMAHASLVTTDLAVTLFVFASVYMLWRVQREPSLANVALFAIAFACAQLTKFSALALLPIVAVLIVIAEWRSSARRTPAAIALLALTGVVTFAAIWAVYGFRFVPAADGRWMLQVYDDPVVQQRVPLMASLVRWSDAHQLLPNAYADGLLLSQAKAQVRGAYLAGSYSTTGWWYYFPIAFLLKAPIALIVGLVLGAVVLVARRAALGTVNVAFVGVPVVVFGGLAIATPLNIGIRHLLPIYPFVILIAAAAASELWSRREGRTVVAVLAVFWCLEFARAYPSPLAFFNAFAGGPQNGSQFLVDSNLDWGQDLKPLKRWMDDHHIPQLALGYFGTADASYYGIRYTPLPGSGFYAGGPLVAPSLPGYVAVSATLLSGVYLDDQLRAFYAPLRAMDPVDTVGYSINIYKVEKAWWKK